ncbi:SusC/RagA family TonB-linked outer membrane protein [Allomuricauda sp. SCSIO 65647]|uniref:SusC/RagA family TonB-linked outer membrane protein n=1 Tax=Allomuricauda sp. SCSIO 65647 TaxID=2908843 RepID=UPI001F368985|nr:SusC/RagA family TonB-linked outer membrane protein [Muricauda sp. SCSIO 65647]UJH66553.1 SusC/RagA family TonB-linked outer membrane protein [Muricauda sp. SCSIO 65647]
MRTKLNGLLTLLLAFFVHISFAQDKTITGTVTDQNGLPLPGVNIVVEGTSTGTQTDFDGNYAVSASVGQTLLFTYIGQRDERRTVGPNDVINVQMSEDAQALEEVVVTAQGIRKEKKALGYAVATVGNEQIEERADTDIGKILRGKAAGVRITGSGGVSGSGSNIIIRGASSITGGNQPLFVVDGVPFDGSSGSANASNINGSGNFQSGNTASRFADIDPNNIESVNILKGLSATALYGGEGRNGVILITTKTGSNARKKFEVSANQSIFFNDIVLPEYQDTWGNGFQNVYGAFFSNWGSRFDSQATIPNAFRTMLLNNYGVEPSSLFPGFSDDPNVEYRPYDSQEAFFNTGIISNTSINVSGALGDKGFMNASFSHTNDQGFIPGNSLRRNNISLGGSYKFDNKITVTGKLNYARTDIQSPFTDASTGSDVTISTAGTGGIASVWNILYLPRSVNIDDPFQHPITGESLWYRGGNDRMNPRWALENTQDANETDRIFGNFNVGYDINDWMNLRYRVGIDNQNVRNRRQINKGGRDGIHPNGYLQISTERFTIWDHSLLLGIDKQLSEKTSLEATIGATTQRRVFQRDGVEGRDQIVFGVQNLSNYVNSSAIIEGTLFPGNTTAYQSFSEENNMAMYASATLGYGGYLYLNGSVRNEWDSTLELDNRAQFSPGVSLSFVPTSAFNGLQSENFLNFLKVRVGYGTSPGFPGPYNTRNILALTPNAFQPPTGSGTTTTSVSNFLANPNLKPELSKEVEAGIEARMFNNRFGFEVTYYNRDTEDQIIQRPLAPETGFTSTFTNVGNVINKGIEAVFDVTPLRSENFEWTLSGNYTVNESVVEGLDEGEQVLYGGIFSAPRNAAINDTPLGVIVGQQFLRDDDGNILIDENGYWLQDPENGVIGDPNPDWFMTVNNSIRWKNFTMNMQWEYQQGGDIYATTVGALIGRGLTESTDFDRTQGIVLPGIRQATGQPNDIQLTATEAYFNNIGFGFDEALIYDATHIRLREASISYAVPSKYLDKTPFGSVSLTLSGQNLFVRSFNVPEDINYDPELNSLGVGNSFGFDYLTSWNSRRYGMSVKLTF